MVDVRGGLRFAFSTIFGPNEKFDPKDLRLDTRLFPGKQEEIAINPDELDKQKDRKIQKAIKKVRERIDDRRLKLMSREGPLKLYIVKKGLSRKSIDEIVEKTKMNNLGLFLDNIESDPQVFADKLKIKSKEELLECLKMARSSFKTLEQTIREPPSVVKTAIQMCFELFQIPKERIKEYVAKDGELLYLDNKREISISFRSNNKIEEMEYLEHIKDDKKNGFEVNWVLFNVDNNRWVNILEKVAIIATTTILQTLIPRISITVGTLIKNAVENKADEILIKGCNMDLKLIFHELLRANLAVEYVKFQKFEANIWDEEKRKTLLKEYGNSLLKSPELVGDKLKNIKLK
jgi:hypothetical protein